MYKKKWNWKTGFLAAFVTLALLACACAPTSEHSPEATLTPTPIAIDPQGVDSGGAGATSGMGGSGSSAGTGVAKASDDGTLEFIDPSLICQEVLTSGACYHPYVPLAEGFSRSYSSEDGEITQTISEVRTDGFTMNIVSPDGEVMASEWSCGENGIAGYEGEDILSEMLGEISGSYSNVEIEGTALPTNIRAGDTWQMVVTITVGVQQAGVDSKNVIVLNVNYTAVGEETITIPAGTLTAMRIDFTTSGENNLEVTGPAGSMSQLLATIEATGSDWYVECLGKVKGTSKSTVSGIASFQQETTMELTSFSLP